MSEYIHLIGAEDVRSAGHTISEAAGQMQRAANSFDETVRMAINQKEDFLDRFERILADDRQKRGLPV